MSPLRAAMSPLRAATTGATTASVSFSSVRAPANVSSAPARSHVPIDPDQKTVTVGDAAPIPFQGDATNNTITFGAATSPTFGIPNAVTATLFMSSFRPVTTYRGVCTQLAEPQAFARRL